MAIVKMKRFRLITLEQDRAAIIAKLQRLGTVEVGDVEDYVNNDDWASLLHRDKSSLGDVKSQITLVDHALEALRKYASLKDGLFTERPFMTEEEFLDSEALESSLQIATAIGDSLDVINRLQVQENRLHGLQHSLTPWKSLTLPINKLSTANVHIAMGTCPAIVDIEKASAALAEAAPLSQLIPMSQDRDQHYLLFVCHRSQLRDAELALTSYAFNPARLTDAPGARGGEIILIAEELESIDREFARIAEERKAEEEKIASYKDERFALRHSMDVLQQYQERESVRDNMLTNGTISFLEGWATATSTDALEKLLGEFTCAYAFEEPTLEETPPTLLKNNRLFTPLSMVTEMYSLPAYHGGIDPNALIFPFFIAFYGIMFGDVGYGLIMFTIGFVLARKYRPKGTIGYMVGLAQIVGVSAFIFGILTGSFFGDLIPVCADVFFGKTVVIPSLISPLEDPMAMLFGALAVGCFQLFVGQCIHIYMGIRDKYFLDALLDVVPWWIFLAGCALLALGYGPVCIWTGVAALVLTQGRSNKTIIGKLAGGIVSLYDVTSWLGDILSYARVMALMLAGGVVASVVNMLGTLPGNIFIFIPIFLFGHSFNLAINTIGNYVHSARLQYLEYFSKFYKDGGVPFEPLSYKTKYVDVIDKA